MIAACGLGVFPPGGGNFSPDHCAAVLRDYIAAHVAIYDAIRANDTVDADGDHYTFVDTRSSMRCATGSSMRSSTARSTSLIPSGTWWIPPHPLSANAATETMRAIAETRTITSEQRARYGGTGPMTPEPDHRLDSKCRKG